MRQEIEQPRGDDAPALAGRALTRRRTLASALALAAAGHLAGLPHVPARARQATPAAAGDEAARIVELAEELMASRHLKAVLLRVLRGREEIVTAALGESMTGVPATTDMHFRNGAVAITYMSTLLLILVDRGLVSLDDPLATWLPELPDAEQVTLRMLANMTAGYPDYVQNTAFQRAFYADPFRAWTPQEQIETGLSTPRVFAPGTNWDYSHTNYVILGLALEAITGQPLAEALRVEVLDPLGLTQTRSSQTAAIPEPVLHAFSSERREALGIPAGTRFYEESTFWNPSWTLAAGAVQTTDITDMAASAIAFGEGTLLSPAAHAAQVSRHLLGFGAPLEGCPNCHTLDAAYSYGLGIVLSGSWILQNPLFAGCGSVAAYLPGERIAIAVATTFAEEAFDAQGDNPSSRANWEIFAAIGALLAPDEAPVTRRQ